MLHGKAGHVFAVEASPGMASVARRLVEINAMQQKAGGVPPDAGGRGAPEMQRKGGEGSMVGMVFPLWCCSGRIVEAWGKLDQGSEVTCEAACLMQEWK